MIVGCATPPPFKFVPSFRILLIYLILIVINLQIVHVYKYALWFAKIIEANKARERGREEDGGEQEESVSWEGPRSW